MAVSWAVCGCLRTSLRCGIFSTRGRSPRYDRPTARPLSVPNVLGPFALSPRSHVCACLLFIHSSNRRCVSRALDRCHARSPRFAKRQICTWCSECSCASSSPLHRCVTCRATKLSHFYRSARISKGALIALPASCRTIPYAPPTIPLSRYQQVMCGALAATFAPPPHTLTPQMLCVSRFDSHWLVKYM